MLRLTTFLCIIRIAEICHLIILHVSQIITKKSEKDNFNIQYKPCCRKNFDQVNQSQQATWLSLIKYSTIQHQQSI